MRKMIKSVVAGVAIVGSSLLQAAPIVFTLPGITEAPTLPGLTTIDFSSGCTYASCSGDFQIVSGSVSGQYAQPANTTGPYLTVPNPVSNGSATFGLGTQADYFGMYWGSIDDYNTISFFNGGSLVGSFTGSDLPPPALDDGNQTSWRSNMFVSFLFFGGETFDSIRLTSTNFAFETDNHTFRAVSVPEPGTLALLGMGLIGVAAARRRRKAA